VEELSDAELVQRIAHGPPLRAAAEAALCERFALRVRLYGQRHLRDAERARDLVQAVLVAVLEAARQGRIDDPQRLDRFVLGTCRNTASRVRQQAARTPLADADAANAALTALPPAHADLMGLFACLRELEERAQRVLQLAFFEERSAEEIAGALALSAGNVRVIRHRALAALRQCLDRGELQL
jgi:RNA polymerase sigma-70 factor (ECF subfamily)